MTKINIKSIVFCPYEKKEIDQNICYTCINFEGNYTRWGSGDRFVSCTHGAGYFDRALIDIVRAGRWVELPAPCNKPESNSCASCDKWGKTNCLALTKESRKKLIKGAKK